MDEDKLLEIALILADCAEGCQTMMESLKLTATSLDDTANILRGMTTNVSNNKE
jgi:hypothetical protein